MNQSSREIRPDRAPRSLTEVQCPRCRAGIGEGCGESYGPIQTFHRERLDELAREPELPARADEIQHRSGMSAAWMELLEAVTRPVGIREDGSCSLHADHPLYRKYVAAGIIAA